MNKIIYTEKGYGLHDAIRKAGFAIREENGEWLTSNNAADVQSIIDTYDELGNTVAKIKADIIAHAAKLRDKVGAGISPYEIAGWGRKIAEAEKFKLTGLDADAPNLEAEASKGGITVVELADKIIANSKKCASLESEIAGNSRFHRNAVAKCLSFDEAMKYDWSTGWPVV